MVRVLNMLFFDAATGKWSRSKPQPPPQLAKMASFPVVVVQFRCVDPPNGDAAAATARQVTNAIQLHVPFIIALNGVHEHVLKYILDVDWVRATYGVTEAAQTRSSVLLWHAALPVQMAEGSDKPLYTAINMRRFYDKDCVVVSANYDETSTPETRLAEVSMTLQKNSIDGATTLALFNPYSSAQYSGKIREVLAQCRERLSLTEDHNAPEHGPTLWMKGCNMLHAGSFPIDVADRAVTGCIVATLRPMTGRSPVPESVSTPTPGSESADALTSFPGSPHDTAAANNNAALVGLKKKSWNLKHSCTIRVRENTDEVCYDLTPYFAKLEDAIKALNSSALSWPADFAIAHGRLLASQGHTADIPSFRQYMSGHRPPPNVAVLLSARQPETTRRTRESMNFSPNSLHHQTVINAVQQRRRMWSAARTTLLYQVSPREMKFDITELAGVGPGALLAAVARLNGEANRKQGSTEEAESDSEDPLQSYRFDYALLYCAERHGYWLIAAADVPCDVAPCRVAAQNLSAPVCVLLRNGGTGN